VYAPVVEAASSSYSASVAARPPQPPSLELEGSLSPFRFPEYDGELRVPLGPELAEWLGGGTAVTVRLPFVEVSRGARNVRLALGVLPIIDASGSPAWLPDAPTLRRGVVTVSSRAFASLAVALGFKVAWVVPGRVLRLGDPGALAGTAEDGKEAVGEGTPGVQVPALDTPGSKAPEAALPARVGKPATAREGMPRRTGVLRIVLDPGHGGADCGARGRGGTFEKAITLDLAKRLGDYLKRHGFEVSFTRDQDEYVDLKDRVRFAGRAAADLLVSIHVNASRNRSARGVETYRYGRKVEGAAAAALVSRENADSDYVDILGSLAQDGFQEQSIQVAGNIEKEMVARLRTLGRSRQKIMEAPFYVLAKAGRPAVLLEVGFISNATEERRLKDPGYRQKLVEAIGSGLLKGTSRWRS